MEARPAGRWPRTHLDPVRRIGYEGMAAARPACLMPLALAATRGGRRLLGVAATSATRSSETLSLGVPAGIGRPRAGMLTETRVCLVDKKKLQEHLRKALT